MKTTLCAVGKLSHNTKVKCLGKVFYVVMHDKDRTVLAHPRHGIIELYSNHIVKVIES